MRIAVECLWAIAAVVRISGVSDPKMSHCIVDVEEELSQGNTPEDNQILMA